VDGAATANQLVYNELRPHSDSQTNDPIWEQIIAVIYGKYQHQKLILPTV